MIPLAVHCTCRHLTCQTLTAWAQEEEVVVEEVAEEVPTQQPSRQLHESGSWLEMPSGERDSTCLSVPSVAEIWPQPPAAWPKVQHCRHCRTLALRPLLEGLQLMKKRRLLMKTCRPLPHHAQ